MGTLLCRMALLCITIVLGCTMVSAPRKVEEVGTTTAALTAPIRNDFEDGTTQGWFPFGSPTVANSTDVANTGTHSLLTTNRTATFMGPGLSLTGQLTAGANYAVSVAARLTAGEAPTTLQVTVMRTMSDGTNAFDTVVPSMNVTADAWVILTGNYSFTATNVTGLILYVQSASATESYYIDTFSLTQAAPPPLSYDFEDGKSDGWFPFGSPTVANSTDVAFTGTHSLKITNRTASFMGPGLNLQTLLTKGATYQVTLSVRLVAGQPASTILATVARTPTGGTTAFDSVASSKSNVTDQAWVTMTGIYSFATDNSGLIFFVQTSSGNASFYIDTVSFTQVAPPPGPPGNTNGASSSFESGTAEGWKPRIGPEALTVTNADAHSGNLSLLTSNRGFTFEGPAFDVTNVMFNGSTYVVSVWAKLAPGQPDSQLRVSLDRKLGTSVETFHTVVGNTPVTANAWVRLQTTYPLALANSSLTLYIESASGTASFYIDDFSIIFVPPAIPQSDIPSVFQTLAPFFPRIGTAVLPADILGEPAVLLTKHFNSITSGNDMKWDATEPTEGNFNFTQADAEVAFAQANNMHVRGHTLVWHNQTPAWVFQNASGNPLTNSPADQALLTQRMQNHIQTVMTHFGNAVPVWDVVNEPIDPSQPDGFRRSPWFNVLGPQYIDIALQAARAANPNAILYINDFDTTNPAHRDPLIALVNNLKSRGIPIDGIGHQMHNNVDYPPPQTVIDAVNLFAATGVEQAVTEMDVSIYSGTFPTPFTSYTDIPQSRHTLVGYSYLGFIDALKHVQDKIVSITIWGTSDDKSWLTSSTKVDAPLLFDPSLQAKPAYWALVDPLQLPGANLSVVMTAAPAVTQAGQATTYTITVTNVSDHDQSFDPPGDDLPAANVSLTTETPPHTAFQSLTVPSGWSCTTPAVGTSGQVTCTIASLATATSAQFALVVTINDCSTQDASSIIASASVTSTTPNPNPTPNTTAMASVQVSNPPPVITAVPPLAITAECATSYVDPGATATAACQGPVPVSSSSNVNVNAVGTYSVIYNATDSAGGQATPVTRTVSVIDTTPPVVTIAGPNPLSVECGSTFTDPGATAIDSCTGPLPVTVSGGVNAGAVGNYTLAYSATDPSGNIGSVARLVKVADTTPPVLTVATPGPLLWSPNHAYVTFATTDLVTGATDVCDHAVSVGEVVITRATSDEPLNAPGSGNTINDIVISGNCHSIQLRAERDGGGNGRVYTVFFRVTDASGNRTTNSVKVTVPLDQSGSPAVDDGPAYTITSACN
jgi:endo-1,4-beta-xylanase